MKKSILPVLLLISALIILNVADLAGFKYISQLKDITPIILIAALLLVSALSSALAKGTIFPSFLIALFTGVSLNNVLKPIVDNEVVLVTVVTICAVYILFSGGLEIVYKNFKKILAPTLILSFGALLLSTFLFPAGLMVLDSWLDVGLTIPVVLLLGAILASTDPAAIIPVLKELKFKKNEVKDIVVSESALTDVTGTLVTFAFLYYLGSGGAFTKIYDGLFALGSYVSLEFLVKEIIIGVIAGIVGFLILHAYLIRRRSVCEDCSDVALFIAAPLIAFGLAAIFHGSGYLASFIAGLLVLTHEKVHKTEAFFVSMTDGIAKPLIFILLGAMIDLPALIAYAPIGILAGVFFIFIVRPLSVFLSLYLFRKKVNLTTEELWFISSVRETGVIPAVLLLQTMSTPGLILGPSFLSIGMWVIIMTLVILPSITPYIARKLHVADTHLAQ